MSAALDITIEQGATFQNDITLRKPSGTNVASGALVVGSLYYVNGYISVKNGDNFWTDGSVFEAQETTYTTKGGGTVELMQAINLTDYTVRGKIKDKFGGTVQATFTCTITDAANGKFSMVLSATITAALTPWAKAFYDVEIVSLAGVVTRVLGGRAIFSSEVTT